MEEYLEHLLAYILEERLPAAKSSRRFLICSRQVEHAFDVLCQTFSEQQHDLYCRYEELRNELASMRDDLIFAETFSLAREIFR